MPIFTINIGSFQQARLRPQASGYTMEYSTLDENFVDKLWTTDKQLYD